MIDGISIDGYKCLKGVDLDVKNLNVLVGPNASGKSSLIQALLLLRQSADKNGSVDGLHLSGPLYEAGTVTDVFHPSAEHQIKIGIKEDGVLTEWLFKHDRNAESPVSKRLIPVENSKHLPSVLYNREDGFSYLNAERIGPRVAYSLPPDSYDLGGCVGKSGEYTTAALARASSGICVHKWDEDFAKHLAKGPRVLDGQELLEDILDTQGRLDLVCNQMLGWVIPGAMFDAKEYEQTDSATLLFFRDKKTKIAVRTTHVGFGLGYTLPIIVASLASHDKSLLLIENPEAHLHPFSQSRIGVFLALMAASGRQIFLETHSDHVINGIRLAVSNGMIDSGLVKINFFNGIKDNDSAEVLSIGLKDNGRLDKWPSGFFDQIESDLSKL